MTRIAFALQGRIILNAEAVTQIFNGWQNISIALLSDQLVCITADRQTFVSQERNI